MEAIVESPSRVVETTEEETHAQRAELGVGRQGILNEGIWKDNLDATMMQHPCQLMGGLLSGLLITGESTEQLCALEVVERCLLMKMDKQPL